MCLWSRLPEFITKAVIASVPGAKEDDFVIHLKSTSPHIEIMERENMYIYSVVFIGDQRIEHPYFKGAIQKILDSGVSKCTILVDLVQKCIIFMHLRLQNPSQDHVTVDIVDHRLNLLCTRDHKEVKTLGFASRDVQGFVKDVFATSDGNNEDGALATNEDYICDQSTRFVDVVSTLVVDINRLKDSQPS